MPAFNAPPTAKPTPTVLSKPAQPLERTRQAWYNRVQRGLNAIGLSPNSERGNQLVPPFKTESQRIAESLPATLSPAQRAAQLAAIEAAAQLAANVGPPAPPDAPVADVVMTKLWAADP